MFFKKKKYKLLKKDKIKYDGKTLYRIKALKSFGVIKKGTKGGYIENERNLSQNGNCWIMYLGRVYENARVFNDALVLEGKIHGNALIDCNALVDGRYCEICGKTHITDYSKVFNNAKISGNVCVRGSACITTNAKLLTDDDYAIIQGFGRDNRITTFYRSRKGGIWVECGCFNGNLSEFRDQVKNTHKEGSQHRKEYLEIANLMERRFKYRV